MLVPLGKTIAIKFIEKRLLKCLSRVRSNYLTYHILGYVHSDAKDVTTINESLS